MRFFFTFAVLVLPGLPGCLDVEDDEEGAPDPPAAFPYATFRCPDQRFATAERAGEGNGTRCNVRVTNQTPGHTGPANELTIAVDPTNPLRLVAGGKDYALGPDSRCGETRVWAGYYWSDDGGFTWGNNLMPGHDQELADQASAPLAGYGCTTDPVVSWAFDGAALFSGLSYAQDNVEQNAVGSNVWLAQSGDGGKTYGSIVVVAQGDGVTTFHDKQWFVADEVTGNLYFTWSMFVFQPTLPSVPGLFGTDQVVFSRSDDGGFTWTPPRVLYETQRTGPLDAPAPEQFKQFSMPQVDKDGTIHVVWMGDAEIWYTRSMDAGNTWLAARPIATNLDVVTGSSPTAFRASTYPVLAVDRSDNATANNLYVAYAAQTADRGADVFLVRSTDGGNAWEEPVRVNDDASSNDQLMPWIDVGPLGDVHVAFYDRRDDPANRLLHAYYAHSTNGSAFEPNVRVSEVAVNSTLSRHQGGFEFLGDYIGVVEGANGWVHPVWVDTRNGRADAYTTVLVRGVT